MSFYLDRLEAVRRRRQPETPGRGAAPAAGGAPAPPTPLPCGYQHHQHAAATLPRNPCPPVPPLHAGGGGGVDDAGGTWRGGSAAVGAAGSGAAQVGAAGLEADAGDGARGAAGSATAGGEMQKKRFGEAPTPHARCPPPKRRAVAPARRRFPPGCGRDAGAPLPHVHGAGDDGSRFVPALRRGGPGAPLQESAPPRPTTTTLAGGNDGVLLFQETASPGAAAAPGSSALNEASAEDGAAAGATTDGARRRRGAVLVKPSEAPGKNSAAAAKDGLCNDTASQGVAEPGNGDQLPKNKDHLAPAMRLLPKPGMVSARRRFPPGCRRLGPPLLAGGGSSQVWSPPSGPADREDMEIVAPLCTGTADGAAQNEELEEGEIARERDVQDSPIATLHDEATACRHGAQEPPIATLHDEATACRHGASAPGITETHTSTEGMIGSTRHCEENRTSGSSCSVPAESSAQGFPKDHQRDEAERVPECATTVDTACSYIAARISDEVVMTRKKVMFTPRKSVKPPKSIQKPSLNIQCRPFSKEIEEDPMSADKCQWTKGKEAATVGDYFGPKKKVNVKGQAHLPANVAAACTLGTMEKPDASKEDYSNLEDDEIFKALAAHDGNFEHGPQNADARSKVKMVCSRFESICRAIVQAVEQRSLKVRRIDLAADKLIRKLPGFTKLGPIIGDVPGVEVGDEFLYRVELALVGLHRPYQGGIDTTRDETGLLIAISVVASGGYPDERSRLGELIYTGSGKNGEDQKLGNGNLALKNCIERKTPVRVIHGFKGDNREGSSHSRAKVISTFTYDGLYHVVDCWKQGRPGSKVFKYKLQRIPGQPGLDLHTGRFVGKNNF